MVAVSLGSFGLDSYASQDLIDAPALSSTSSSETKVDFGSFKLPYNHENLLFRDFLGKATIVFNMKLDDPQTATQFPELKEIYNRYSKDGLKVHAFPSDQVGPEKLIIVNSNQSHNSSFI